jgi:hypothetical protein
MDRKIRPSGLTTFAILNFVFAGVSVLGILLSIGCTTCVKMTDQSGQAVSGPEITALTIVFSVLNLVLVGLLIASGIGYLKLNRILGRWCGNLYALGQIVLQVIGIAAGVGSLGEVTLFTVSAFVWPALTLFFINVVFRDVWKRRTNIIEAVKNSDAAGEETEDTGAGTAPPHLILVMMQSIRQTLRGVQGIVFIWITLILCFSVAGVLLLPYELAVKASQQRSGLDEATAQLTIKEGVKQTAYGFFVWLFDEAKPDAQAGQPPPSRWAEYVTREKPAYLSFIFAVLMALFPVLCAFLVFNQISDDARRKGFRYLLLRTTRASLYFGKFLAAVAIMIPIIILSVAAIAAYIHFKLGYYAVEDIISWSLWGMLMLSLISIPSIAFCLAVSALINFGFGSLAASALSLGLFPVITRLLKDAAQPFVAAQFVLPLKTAYFLFHPEWWVALLAALGCLLYAAVFSAGGFLYFKRKSL